MMTGIPPFVFSDGVGMWRILVARESPRAPGPFVKVSKNRILRVSINMNRTDNELHS